MRAAHRAPAGGWILDAGGGTGEHAARMVAAGRHAVVLDPSPKMLHAAAARPGVVAVRGRAQRLPFRDASMDATYHHVSLHYGDWRQTLDEAWRVVRPGGTIWIWTFGRDHFATSLLSRWFPSIEAIEIARFPDPAAIVGHLRSKGAVVTRTEETETARRTAGEWAAAVEGGFVSTLQLLSEDELRAGLAAFRERHPDPDEILEYPLRYTGIQARR